MTGFYLSTEFTWFKLREELEYLGLGDRWCGPLSTKPWTLSCLSRHDIKDSGMNGYIDERMLTAARKCPNKTLIRWHSMHCACAECLEADAYVCYCFSGVPLSYISPPVDSRELEEQ